MYLKRLELRGFKTFALHTDFLFDAGITAIVGPNGSGKSNIADAVRWVLGEQTYSALRGKRTEDMIFAGTSRRAQLGMAEAVVTFDNSSRWLPIDFSEVTVSRRAYRSGENQYFVNGSRVRLRDVLDLLGRAGLGRGGFVVLGQGLVDAALSLRPEERRTLFEEAAGIHVYREKRNDALSKLSETQNNLLRVNDILNEIAPRLRELERQAKRAAERELLQRDLERLLRIWYGYHWHRAQAQMHEADAMLQRRQEDLNMGRGHLHELDALLSSSHSRQNELRRQLSVWHKQSSELHALAEVKGRELAVARERMNQMQERRDDLNADLAQAESRSSALQESLASAQAEQARLRLQVQAEAVAMQTVRADLQTAQAAVRHTEDTLNSERESAFQLATAQADAANRVRQMGERCDELCREQAAQEHELQSLLGQFTVQQAEVTRLTANLAELLARLAATENQLQGYQTRIVDGEKQLEQRRSAQAASARAYERLETRSDLLRGLRENMAGFTPGVRALMDAHPSLPGIVGPIATLLRVPQELERAVEAALGAHTQSLVVERWQDAEAAIRWLRKNAAGQATFLPLDFLPSLPSPAVPSGKGILGSAQDLIDCDERLRPAVRQVLGSIAIVQDLETARLARSQLAPGQALVTVEGDLVHASGMLSGGSETAQGGMLAQEREWRELPPLLDAAREATLIAANATQQSESTLARLRKDLTTTLAEQAGVGRDRDRVQGSCSSLQQNLERHQHEITWRQNVQDQRKRELAALEDKATALEREAANLAEQHGTRKASLNALLEHQELFVSSSETARLALAQAETNLAVTQRQSRAHEQLVAGQQASLEQLHQEIAARSQRLSEMARQVADQEMLVGQQQSEASTLSARIAEVSLHLDPAEAELSSLEEQLVSLDQELTRARQRVSELEILHNQQILERERRQDALEAMEQHIEEDLGDIEYPTERVQQLRMEFLARDRQVLGVPETLPDNLNVEVRDLKARLRRLGGVNPAAPQEYQDVHQRHEFLRTQLADLQQSSSSLQQVIKELDQVMEREFLSVFTDTAEHFAHYFEHLFGGGQAKLTLADPDSPSSSGVEIIARPPGRRQQSLALLSGGERALTATALLFALLKVKPMPFSMLDEVDAMLDEANVGRFRDLLKEFSALTQFIIISHNRTTIEAANTLYGVSMTEDGISRVVSMRLKDKGHPVSETRATIR